MIDSKKKTTTTTATTILKKRKLYVKWYHMKSLKRNVVDWMWYWMKT